MSSQTINADTICDLQGRPLQPGAVTLLKALDKLLTVGAYYSAEHDQYLQAAVTAGKAIVGVIGGARFHATIEITAQGLMVGGQNIDPNHRNVRLLHDLLVPLNIARLEIDGTLTPEDLRQALAALQKHKLSLGRSNTFQEIVISDLPPSVRTVSCSVLHQAGDEQPASGDSLSLDKSLSPVDDDAAGQVAESRSEYLARQFMGMVTQILENLERIDREAGIAHQDGEGGSYVTKAELMDLKHSLQRLVEVNPDPAELAKLISNAQRALDLSRDPQSVNLVFQILKKDMTKKDKGNAGEKDRKSSPVKFKMTVEELLGSVGELEIDAAPVIDPWAGSRTNQLGIGLHLLRSDPPRALRTSLIEVIELAVDEPDFADHNLRLCAAVTETIVRQDGAESLDDLLPLITGTLRLKSAEMVAPFWVHLVELAAADHLPELWPHLVNDILLGFDKAPREMVTELVLVAGDIPLTSALSLSRRLEKQPALQGKSAALDLFFAPPPRLYPVYTALMASPLKGWLGEEIFRALRTNPLSPLVHVVMAALGEHQPEYVAFYLDLILHSTEDQLPDEVQKTAADILQRALTELTPEKRRDDWVPRGLNEFWKLEPDLARPLLERVLSARKFFFFKVWPALARNAAERALAADRKEVK